MTKQIAGKVYRSYRHKDRVIHEQGYRRRNMPYMTELWYPEAKRDELEHAGAMLSVAPWRGVLHTTEGSSYAGARGAYVANRSAPHFTVSFEGSTFRAWQHIPLNRAARALRNKAGGVDTNRLRCIQIEIVGKAAQAAQFSDAYLAGIARLMRWIERNTEIKRSAPTFVGSYAAVQRLTNSQWMLFNGWCGHQHVPENTHWDPGKINMQYLLHHEAGGVKPMYDPPIIIAMVASLDDPETGGTWILDQAGAIFSFGGAQYYGGANGKWYFGDRKAAQLRLGSSFDTAPWNLYKYVIIATDGGMYGYPGE